MSIYLDTSALAKRYVPEARSAAVDAFVDASDEPLVITPLVGVEVESLLRRLLRTRLIDDAYAAEVQRHYAADIATGLWQIEPFAPAIFPRAAALLRELGQPLRTLDALHLAAAIDIGCKAIATADRQLARAAAGCGLQVHSFA